MKARSILFAVIITIAATSCSPAPVKSSDSNSSVATGSGNTPKAMYQSLLREQQNIEMRISELTSGLGGLSVGKAKKVQTEIDKLVDQKAVIDRRLAAFPESIRNPSSVKSEDDSEFRRQLEQRATERIASSDPYAGQLSEDKELERAYRDYLNAGGQEQAQRDANAPQVYRLMLTITKDKIPASKFKGISDVFEQRVGSSGYVYYQGEYSSKAAAEKARKTIAKKGFASASIVAMVGDRRVDF